MWSRVRVTAPRSRLLSRAPGSESQPATRVPPGLAAAGAFCAWDVSAGFDSAGLLSGGLTAAAPPAWAVGFDSAGFASAGLDPAGWLGAGALGAQAWISP